MSSNVFNSNYQDNYLPSLESLLNNQNWNNTPDIIKVTIQTLNDKIISLNDKLNNLESEIGNKISKNEFQNNINSKVDMSEYIKTITNLTKNIQNYPSMEYVKYIEEDKLSKNDFNNIIKEYTLNKDMKNILENSNLKNINELSSNLNSQMDNFTREINKKLNVIPTMNDIKKINQTLTLKANITDLNNVLSTKVNKDEITNILRTKCDKKEFENQIKKKIDITEYNELINILNSKVNYDQIEEIKINLLNKLDKNSFNQFSDLINNKLDIKDFNSFIECEYKNYIKENNNKVKEIDEDIDRLINNIKIQFNNVNNVISKIDNDKIGKNTFDELIKQFQDKFDKKDFFLEFNQFKLDINDKISEMKNYSDKNKSLFEEMLNTKIDEVICSLNKKIEGLNFDFQKLNCHFNNISLNLDGQNKILEDLINKISIFENENENKFCQLYEIIKSKLNIKDYTEITNCLEENIKNEIIKGLQNKATFKDLEMLFNNIQKDTNEKFLSHENEIKKIINKLENLISSKN